MADPPRATPICIVFPLLRSRRPTRAGPRPQAIPMATRRRHRQRGHALHPSRRLVCRARLRQRGPRLSRDARRNASATVDSCRHCWPRTPILGHAHRRAPPRRRPSPAQVDRAHARATLVAALEAVCAIPTVSGCLRPLSMPPASSPSPPGPELRQRDRSRSPCRPHLPRRPRAAHPRRHSSGSSTTRPPPTARQASTTSSQRTARPSTRRNSKPTPAILAPARAIRSTKSASPSTSHLPAFWWKASARKL